MKTLLLRCTMLVLALLGPPAAALANDVDGPDDCTHALRDFGDAPEGNEAYPGVIGLFPTCSAPHPAGTQQIICAPLSTPPGAANGFVRHENPAGGPRYWLGCFAGAVQPLGVDSESDGKTNSNGGAFSTCSPNVAIDCVEPSWLNFGQDECYGDDDACLSAPLSFSTCQTSSVTFRAFNCLQTARVVTLNILVDWNQDGDWNDNFECAGPALGCSYEWAVKNVQIVLPPGCSSITSPTFVAGPNAGRGWLRITISDNAAPDDFPWNGSAGLAGQIIIGGETEDYPVTIDGPVGCDPYRDYGDAPEHIVAYSNGAVGHFPTCEFPGAPGTQEIECGAPSSPAPGATGFVRHDAAATDLNKFWLGCGAAGFSGVDSESNGKMNSDPPLGTASRCDPSIAVDCFEPAWLNFGQDECYGDNDAGVPAFLTFTACTSPNVSFRAFNCSPQPLDVFLNILVDFNADGDWNDNIRCSAATPGCATEWAVKNVPIPLNVGCNAVTSPSFPVGRNAGESWMRITITEQPVPEDFPWNGSVSMPNSSFRAGETEDYPIRIAQSPLGVGENESGSIELAAATPNPARSWTQLRWSQPRAARATLAIYDVVGRRVSQLVASEMPAGEHRVSWSFTDDDGGVVAPGIYLAKLRIEGREFTTRIVRLR